MLKTEDLKAEIRRMCEEKDAILYNWRNSGYC